MGKGSRKVCNSSFGELEKVGLERREEGEEKKNSPDLTPHCRNNTFLPSPTALFSLAGRKKPSSAAVHLAHTGTPTSAWLKQTPLCAESWSWRGEGVAAAAQSFSGLLWWQQRRRNHGRLSHAAGTLFFGATTTVLQPRKQPPSSPPIPHLLLRPPCSPLPPPTLPRTHTQTYITPRSLHATASEEARSLANRADLKIPESTKKQLRMLLFFHVRARACELREFIRRSEGLAAGFGTCVRFSARF